MQNNLVNIFDLSALSLLSPPTPTCVSMYQSYEWRSGGGDSIHSLLRLHWNRYYIPRQGKGEDAFLYALYS